jgi:EAL domain-containing protein (putative c-di-GMP-specific phosphodiesterase class I)
MSGAGDTMILAPGGPSAPTTLDRLIGMAAEAGIRSHVACSVLVLSGDAAALGAFAKACATAVTPAEAAATRVLRLDAHVDLDRATAMDVLAQALAADSLATLVARAVHGGMLDALERGEGVQAAYQPLVDIASGRTVAFEALLRLAHDGRPVPPLEVFSAAADVGRLAAADAAARHAAIRGAAGWIGPRPLHVNLLPEAIARPNDLDATDQVIVESGFERGQVVFEVDVRSSVDERHLARVLEHLRHRGYGIALDDVSDDPAALAMIDRVRPDVVKVARPLVADLPSIAARSAVATVVGAAHAAGARVAAKGIETAAQLDAVRFVGVDDAQGWQVGQPMKAPGQQRTALAS